MSGSILSERELLPALAAAVTSGVIMIIKKGEDAAVVVDNNFFVGDDPDQKTFPRAVILNWLTRFDG